MTKEKTDDWTQASSRSPCTSRSNHWPTIGQPLANHWSTIAQPLANHWPTIVHGPWTMVHGPWNLVHGPLIVWVMGQPWRHRVYSIESITTTPISQPMMTILKTSRFATSILTPSRGSLHSQN